MDKIARVTPLLPPNTPTSTLTAPPPQSALFAWLARPAGLRWRQGLVCLLALAALTVSILLTPARSAAADKEKLSAADIFARSQAVNPGNDQQSKLTLIISDADGNTRKAIIKRYWKNYHGKDNVEAKVLLFHEYPPESRGTAFMVWTYTPASGLPPDQWLYLPILRKVTKLPVQAEENIQGSDLRGSDMDPRPVGVDRHTLVREENIGTQRYYVVESEPVKPEKGYAYSKVVRWISADNFLIDKVDYFGLDGRLLKKQTISWSQVGDAWVWRKVVIANVQTGSKTTLNLSDVQVNQGLNDARFTERTMQRGAEALR